MPAEQAAPAALSVDTDLLAEYARFYGRPAPTDDRLLFERAVDRALQAFEAAGARATFFVIGRHLQDREGKATVRRIHDAGHEVANHTDTHPFGFAALPPTERAEEIRRAHGRIGDALGVAPRGFRSPSFAPAPDVFEELAALGYRWDSSLLPTWAHLPMRWMQRRRSTGNIADGFGTSAAVLAPRLPHPVGPPEGGLMEIPAAVTPGLRLPFTHTVSLHLGRFWLRRMAGAFPAGEAVPPYVFHLIDFLGLEADGLPGWMRHHPGAARPLSYKRAAAAEALGLLGAGRRPVDLSTYLEALQPALVPA